MEINSKKKTIFLLLLVKLARFKNITKKKYYINFNYKKKKKLIYQTLSDKYFLRIIIKYKNRINDEYVQNVLKSTFAPRVSLL